MATDESLHLCLDAEPENIGLARAAVADLASSCGMKEPTLGDLKTVLSEACSNVVRHAYPGVAGSFEVEAAPEDDALSVVVRDFGTGMRARTADDESSMRLGLGLISMLSSRFEITGNSGGGTELRVRLPLSP
ncbi:MAG TPA: ATP-binding protein [Solirubrobacterales bacterium]|nr:ATP-binding protein [Solirubrobacterales bacterium]